VIVSAVQHGSAAETFGQGSFPAVSGCARWWCNPVAGVSLDWTLHPRIDRHRVIGDTYHSSRSI